MLQVYNWSCFLVLKIIMFNFHIISMKTWVQPQEGSTFFIWRNTKETQFSFPTPAQEIPYHLAQFCSTSSSPSLGTRTTSHFRQVSIGAWKTPTGGMTRKSINPWYQSWLSSAISKLFLATPQQWFVETWLHSPPAPHPLFSIVPSLLPQNQETFSDLLGAEQGGQSRLLKIPLILKNRAEATHEMLLHILEVQKTIIKWKKLSRISKIQLHVIAAALG